MRTLLLSAEKYRLNVKSNAETGEPLRHHDRPSRPLLAARLLPLTSHTAARRSAAAGLACAAIFCGFWATSISSLAAHPPVTAPQRIPWRTNAAHPGVQPQAAVTRAAKELADERDASATADNTEPAHLKFAEQLVADLTPDHNSYAYRPIYIHWKGQDGWQEDESHCDCSGFLTLLLEHAYHYTPADFRRWTGHSRPLAHVYYEQIRLENGFTRIRRIHDIQRGDILAVKYLHPTKDTGHIMIVAGPPRRRQTTAPVQADTRQWEVPVIDSAMSGHGPLDTRHRPDGAFDTGVGRGTIRLYSDSHGDLAGYTWSTLRVSTFYDAGERPMVIGRLRPGFQP